LAAASLARSLWQRAALWIGGADAYYDQWFGSEPFLVVVYCVVVLAAFRRLGKYYRVGRCGWVMAAVFLLISGAATLSTQQIGVVGWPGAPQVVFLARQYVGIVFAFLLLSTWFLGSFRMNLPANITRHMRILRLYFGAQWAGLVLLNLDMAVAASFVLVGVSAACYGLWCVGLVPDGERYESEPLITDEEFEQMLEPGKRLSRTMEHVRRASRADSRNSLLG